MNHTGTFMRLPVAEAFILSGMLPYRARQVLSRNVYRRGDDSLTVFSFEAGEGLSREVLHTDCLYWLVVGSARLASDVGGGPVVSGQCLMVPAGEAHALDLTSRSKIVVATVGSPSSKEMAMGSVLIKNIDKSMVVTLRDVVAVEKDTVTSITLAQNDRMTMTVFAFDAGTGTGTHSSDGDAMVNALAGVGEITIGEAKHTLTAGQSIIMPAGIPHAVGAGTESFTMLLIVVRP